MNHVVYQTKKPMRKLKIRKWSIKYKNALIARFMTQNKQIFIFFAKKKEYLNTLEIR